MSALRTFQMVLLTVLCLACPAIASPSHPAHFDISVSPSPIHPGEAADIKVTASIEPGWHLYSLSPVQQPGPSATVITVQGKVLTALGQPWEDKPISQFDPNFQKTVGFHVGRAVFHLPVRVSKDAAGSVSGTISIGYQTCNDSVCLPPRTDILPFALSVTPGAIRPQYAGAPHPPVSDKDLTLFLAAAFGAGLLSLITPCVFPLIPITLTTFIKQAGGDRSRLVTLAAGYSLGIVVLYVAVGALTTVFLGASGISRLAINPWVNLFAFAVFVLFAFSFFEIIRLELPGNLGALQAAARAKGGLIGLGALGIVFVLASFTCTAPFIGTLLVAAAGRDILRPLFGTLAYSLAFVSPFLLFSLFPKWVSKLPKSGVWLARVKATLGFIELAAALKFLSNSDLIWQWHLLTKPVLLALWAVIFVAIVLYLVNIFRFGIVAETEPKGAPVPPIRFAIAGFFLLSAGYCVWGDFGGSLSPYVEAFLPPVSYGSNVPDRPGGLTWNANYDAALASAQNQGKMLFVDFTGYTCTNCRLNENKIFPEPSVKAELGKFVRVELYTDGGLDAAKNEQLELSKFDDVALPLYGVVSPATGAVVAQTAGVQSVEGFRQFLRSAEEAGVQQNSEAAWSPYTDSAVAEAGRPVIIDFTANWCTNCKAIERTVFVDPAVTAQLLSFATFRSDMTDYYSSTNAALQKKYGILSLPAIVFLDRTGKEVPGTRVTGLITTKDFLSRIKTALAM